MIKYLYIKFIGDLMFSVIGVGLMYGVKFVGFGILLFELLIVGMFVIRYRFDFLFCRLFSVYFKFGVGINFIRMLCLMIGNFLFSLFVWCSSFSFVFRFIVGIIGLVLMLIIFFFFIFGIMFVSFDVKMGLCLLLRKG